MTELQWLIRLLTKEKLTASIKDLVIERIGVVESLLIQAPVIRSNPNFGVVKQAPSTQKLLEEMGQQTAEQALIGAQTQAAVQALQARQQAIASAGKTEPGRISPRKF